MREDPLVSVIMPLYNAESYVAEAIGSVMAQTYQNWELIVVDDCSTDGSLAVVEGISDARIRVLRQDRNGGAAKARNRAVEESSGDVLSYLDSDDAWMPEKLDCQLAFMRKVGAPLCFTSYETVREDGSHYNYVHVPTKLDYCSFLKNTITCGHTMALDLDSIPRELVFTPINDAFDYPEDLVTWLQILKAGNVAYGLDECLATNRKREGSRSANHFAAVGRTWNAYRRIEGLGSVYSAYCLFWQVFHAVLKRL